MRVRLFDRIILAIFPHSFQGTLDRIADLMAGFLLNLMDLAHGFERKLMVCDCAILVKTGRVRQQAGCLVVSIVRGTDLLFNSLSASSRADTSRFFS